MAQVFISYRRVESSMLATLIARELEEKGLSVFVDTRSIDGGGPFPDRLRQAIETCDVFVCLLGATSLASEWVREEIAHARKHGKVLIPVFQERYVAPEAPDENVRGLLQSDGIHVLDVKNLYVDEAIGRLALMVKGSIARRAKPRRRISPMVVIAILALIVIGAAIVAALLSQNQNPSEPPLLPASETPSSPDTTPLMPPSDTPAPNASPETAASPELSGTADPLAVAMERAAVRMATNADWQQLYPAGFAQTFDGVEMVLVPAGCFTMGSSDGDDDEMPVHPQCINAPFWLDKYEVTNELFARLDGQAEHPSYWPDLQRPRESLTWNEARDFCLKRNLRLPTELEWEYAARGPDSLVYPWGASFVPENAVYYDNGNGKTADVGTHPGGVSWTGAQDMSGNVWEWTGTWYASYEYRADDDRDDPADTSSNPDFIERVVRGGSWYNSEYSLRTSYRARANPAEQTPYYGFRCAFILYGD